MDKRFKSTNFVLNMDGSNIKQLLYTIATKNHDCVWIQDTEGVILPYGDKCVMTIFWCCIDGANVAFVESSGQITDHKALENKIHELFPQNTYMTIDDICCYGPFAKYL